MSHAGRIIGIPGLEIERVIRRKGIEVWAKPMRRPPCKHCQGDGLRIKATYLRTVKHTRQGNQVMTLHLRVPKYHCQECKRYFRHSFTGIQPRYRASEAYRLEVFEAHDGGVTQRKLSRTHQISPATVERWYQYHINQKRSEGDRRFCPRVLGIDEHFFTRKKGYATTLTDLKNHNVFDVQLGRSELSLRRYLKALEGRERVQVVVMDLSETYRSIARRYFPNATIVADRFHVVRLINQHFLSVWKQHDPEGRKNRGLISLMRRHQWNLRDEQHANLMHYLADESVSNVASQTVELSYSSTTSRHHRRSPSSLYISTRTAWFPLESSWDRGEVTTIEIFCIYMGLWAVALSDVIGRRPPVSYSVCFSAG